MESAGNYYFEIYRLLIEQGANINAKDPDGRTLLILAINDQNLEICQLLINHGADVNAKDNRGRTALMGAASLGNLKICQLLIDHEADVNAKDNKGWTALMAAADRDHLKICQLLINHGADINVKNNNGWTPYDYANKEIKRLLTNSNKSLKKDELVIQYAKEANYYQLKQLMEITANTRDEYGSTVLMHATICRNLDICKLLIDYGANVNARDNYGSTALMHATLCGFIEICKLLINHGADVNAKAYRERTALMWAAYNGNLEICKLLINHGADVNAENNYGETALKIAVSRKNKEIMDLLLSKGANKADALICREIWSWNCVNNGYTNENCIDKISLTIENLSHSLITSITFMLTITNKEDGSVIYKKRHTIYMQLYPGEAYPSDPFPLAQPLYIKANDYNFDIEFISAQ